LKSFFAAMRRNYLPLAFENLEKFRASTFRTFQDLAFNYWKRREEVTP